MGAKQSKLPESIQSNNDISSAQSSLETVQKNDVSPSVKVEEVNVNKDDAPPKTGGCPMKNKNGSYWGGFFSGGRNPHVGPNAIPMSTTKTDDKCENCDENKKTQSQTSSTSLCPVKSNNQPNLGGGGCPVKMGKKDQVQYNVYSQPIDPKNNMPAVENQLPAAQQKEALSTERVSSTIPKGGADDGTTWTYPSPQMFYNSLARKNKLEDTDESAIESVVAIHNNMNEKTWAKVVEWEAVADPDGQKQGGPKLLKFLGRPSDLSPKARFKHMILGHPLPFDRHDWTIVRPDGTEIRYVIDYYIDETRAKETEESALPKMEDKNAVNSILVDVRPALDSPMSIIERGISMPYARNIANSSTFEPLPMLPTDTMKSQVAESEKTWENIQKNVQACKSGTEKPKSMVLTKEQIKGKEMGDDEEDNYETMNINISDEEAVKIAKSFAQMLSDCQKAQKLVDECTDDAECAKASLGLTLCMAKLICPLQHDAVTKSLNSDDLDENDEKSEEIYDKRVAAALTNVSNCIALEGLRANAAKKKFPELFP